MTSISRFILLSLILTGIFSCVGDSGELAEVANIEAATLDVFPGGTVIRGLTQEIEFPVALTEKSDPSLVQSADIMLTFTGLNNTVSGLKVTTVTTFPGTVTFSLADLLDQSGLSIDDLNAGDTWTYSFVLNNKAGSTWKVLGSTRYTFTCPSDIAGEYVTLTSGTSTDGCCTEPVTDFASIVTLTEERPGVYTISDFSAGLYLKWYEVYGITSQADSPGKLQHVCGTVSVIQTTEPFGTPVTGTGTYDDATGIITYTWTNGYGDTGTVTMTPKR